MPNFMRKVKKNVRFSKQFLRNNPQTPSSSAVAYRGPVHVHQKDDSILSVNLSFVTGLTYTTVAGAASFNTVIAASAVTALSDWTDYAATYQSFRVLAIEAKYLPKLENSWNESTAILAATNVSPLYLCPFHGDASAITTEDAAINHQKHTVKPINKTNVATVRMKEVDEAQWFSTTSGTTGIFGIKPYQTISAAIAAAVIHWGRFLVTYAVEFKGRVVSATQKSKLSTISISTSTETKQQVAYETKQKGEVSTKESKSDYVDGTACHSDYYVYVPASSLTLSSKGTGLSAIQSHKPAIATPEKT